MTTGHGIAVAIVYASAEVIGVKAFVVGIAEPLAGTLLIEVAGYRWRATRTGLTIANLTAWAIAAVVGRVAVVIGEAAAFDALLAHGAIIIRGAVWNADAFAVGREGCTGRVLAILIGGAIAVIGASSVFFRFYRLTSAAYTDAIFTIIIV